MSSIFIQGTNTFLTLEDAQVLMADRVDCQGFANATVFKKKAALLQSFRQLVKLPFCATDVRSGQPFNYLDLEDTAEELGALPDAFLNDIKIAQLLQADFLLGGDPTSESEQILRKRQSGIIQERVGESSITYAPLSAQSTSGSFTNISPYSVCPKAMYEIAGWVYRGVRVARA